MRCAAAGSGSASALGGSRSGCRWAPGRRRTGPRKRILETGRRLASLPDDDLQPPPPQAHSRPRHGGSPGGAEALSRRRRRPPLARGANLTLCTAPPSLRLLRALAVTPLRAVIA